MRGVIWPVVFIVLLASSWATPVEAMGLFWCELGLAGLLGALVWDERNAGVSR